MHFVFMYCNVGEQRQRASAAAASACVCVCVCGGPHNMPWTVAVDEVATHQLIIFMINLLLIKCQK